jgi:hypothetical protein
MDEITGFDGTYPSSRHCEVSNLPEIFRITELATDEKIQILVCRS